MSSAEEEEEEIKLQKWKLVNVGCWREPTGRTRFSLDWDSIAAATLPQVVLCEYSIFQIKLNSYLLFDSKLTQLFKIFEYLFDRDQPGDW